MAAEAFDPIEARRLAVSAYNRELDAHRQRSSEHRRWQAEHEAWRRREAALVADVDARRAELEEALLRPTAPAAPRLVTPESASYPSPRQPASLGWPRAADQDGTPPQVAVGWPDGPAVL